MGLEIARLDLRLRRRSMVWYSVGMAVYVILIVVIYPSVKSDSSLTTLAADNPTMTALLGVSGSLTSPIGWVSGNVYANFLPLVVLLLTISYGGSAIAGQSETGMLGLVAALPVARSQLVVEKTIALILCPIPLSIVTMLCVFAGRAYQLNLAIWPVVGTTLAVLILGVDFGLLAMLVGAHRANRGHALGASAAIAAASYLVSSLGPVSSLARALRAASLFYWAIGDNQLESGPSLLGFGVLLAVGLALFAATRIVIERLDIP